MNTMRFSCSIPYCILQTAKNVISAGIVASSVASLFVLPGYTQEGDISSLLEEVVVTAHKLEEG